MRRKLSCAIRSITAFLAMRGEKKGQKMGYEPLRSALKESYSSAAKLRVKEAHLHALKLSMNESHPGALKLSVNESHS